MRKTLPGIFFLIFLSFPSFSQLLSWSPDFPVEGTDPVTIVVDASKGNRGLLNYSSTSDVYVHTGVITNLSTSNTNWRYVKFNQNFNQPNPALQATHLGSNKWQFTITGGVRAYYGVPGGETILKIAILFRNGDGALVQRNVDATDMYISVYTTGVAVRFSNPFFQPTAVKIPEPVMKNIGDNISLTAIANKTSAMKLYLNGSVVQTANDAVTISANPVITAPGDQVIVAEANDGINTTTDTLTFFVAPIPPVGLREGINYDPNNTSVTLVLYAPSKTSVSVIGDFPGSNWTAQPQYTMTNSTDGFYWTLHINGLTPGTEYSYQYVVDGTLKIADPYAEKVLDPYADGSIPGSTYPSLKPYPTGLTTGIVSVLQTAAPVYNWQVTNFQKPDKRNLVIYELLVRDFIANHDWNTLRDTLNYLRNLGVNAVEIMPFNEFENNNSWGYNPDFYFAPDKYYGPENTLKEFIDSAHKKGIAVLMDIALNHSFGLSPMVQLYWNAANNRPAPDNPWFNPVPKHGFNVGYDMNHESLATRYFVSRVVDHWLNNYKIDGFRFDLSKGFTQVQTCDASGNNCDVNAWSSYDASRVDIWKRYYDTLQSKSPGSYCILEHFAAKQEEIELSNYGMLLWGNTNYNYNQASMGYATDWNFDYGIASVRGWSNPYLVTYMESHDEERMMYKNLQFGNASGTYDIKDLNTALKRQEMCAAFLFTIPGPKMFWQFGEQGYKYSINYCQNGTINNSCRTDPKPIRWDYLQNVNRKHLVDVYSALIKLRFTDLYKNLFIGNTSQQDFTGAFKTLKLALGGASILVMGNFDVVPQTSSVTFQNAGIWYDYLEGTTIIATGTAQSVTLQPGEYHVYLNMNVTLPVNLISFNGKNNGSSNLLSWTTSDEKDLSYYELQRSFDGQHFSAIAQVKATAQIRYSFSDYLVDAASIYYYRLKNVDKDGNFKYTAIVTIKRGIAGKFAAINPNPFKDKLDVSVKASLQENATFVLTDLSGRQLRKQSNILSPGNNIIEIGGTATLAEGTYLLTIIQSTKRQTIKAIKGN